MQEWLIKPRQICLWVYCALGLCLSAEVVRADQVAPVAFGTQLDALLDLGDLLVEAGHHTRQRLDERHLRRDEAGELL